MIDLTKPVRPGWDALFVLSLVGLAVAGWFAFAPVKKDSMGATAAQSLEAARAAAGSAEQKAATERGKLEGRVWTVKPEALGTEVLSQVTKLAAQQGLKVVDFRAGRLTAAAGLWEASYTAVLEGSFLSFVKALLELENPQSRLALSQVKVISKVSSDEVTAMVGFTAFLEKEES